MCRPRAATKDKSIFGNILHDQCRRGVSTKMAGQQCEICDQLGHVWATPYGLEQTTNARTFKLVLPSRRRWHPCHSVGQLAQLKQPIWKPSARLHVRADLPAMTDQSRESKQQKVVKKLQRILQSICTRFKMYASSRQHLMQTPIRLTYFSMPFWRRTFEKTMERSNNFRSTAWLSCKACLSMVWFATPPL